jgi:hypothetical protein
MTEYTVRSMHVGGVQDWRSALLGESRVLWKDFRTYIPPEYYVIMETLENPRREEESREDEEESTLEEDTARQQDRLIRGLHYFDYRKSFQL